MTSAKTVIALLAAFWVVMTLNTAFSRRKKRSAPRVTKAELDGFWAAVNAASLPMAKIELAAKPPAHARQSRIGGRPFAGGQAWPLHPRDGQPMLFLAQINFAELPPLEDFPRAGLLQLFVASDDRGKLRTMEAEENRMLRWFPAPEGDDTLPVPARFLGLKSPGALSPRAIETGFALTFNAAMAKGNPENLPLCKMRPDARARSGETQEIQAALDRLGEDCDALIVSYGTHWIGGQPRFAYLDPRQGSADGEPDRVLLHLGFDGDICLSGASDLNLLIRKADLLRRDFTEALCHWAWG